MEYQLQVAQAWSVSAPTQRELLYRIMALAEGRSLLAINFEYKDDDDLPEHAIVVFE